MSLADAYGGYIHATTAPDLWPSRNYSVEQMETYWNDRSIVIWVTCFICGILLWELVTSFPGEIILYHLPILRSNFARIRGIPHSSSRFFDVNIEEGEEARRPPGSFVLNPRRPTEISISMPEDDAMLTDVAPQEGCGSSYPLRDGRLSTSPFHKIPFSKFSSDPMARILLPEVGKQRLLMHCGNGFGLISARTRQSVLSICFFLLRAIVVPYAAICYVLLYRSDHCKNALRGLILVHGLASVTFEVIVFLRAHVALIVFSPRLAVWLTPALCLLITMIAGTWIGQACILVAWQYVFLRGSTDTTGDVLTHFHQRLPRPFPNVPVGFTCSHFRMNIPTLITAYVLQYVVVVVTALAVFMSWRVEGATVLQSVRVLDIVRMTGPRPGERPISVMRRQFVVDMARFLALSTATHFASVIVIATMPSGPVVSGLAMSQFPIQAFFMLAVVPRTILNIRQAFSGSVLPAPEPRNRTDGLDPVQTLSSRMVAAQYRPLSATTATPHVCVSPETTPSWS